MKKILILSYENEAYFCLRLAKELQQQGEKVLCVFCDPHTVDKKPKWLFLARKLDVNFATIEEPLDSFKVQPEIDSEGLFYLQNIEAHYLTGLTLNQLILTDPILSTVHHARKPYYNSYNGKEQYRLAEVLIRWSETLLRTFQPDEILASSVKYFSINAMLHLSQGMKIRSFVYTPLRVEGKFCWEPVSFLPKYSANPQTPAFDNRRRRKSADKEKYKQALLCRGSLYIAQSARDRKRKLRAHAARFASHQIRFIKQLPYYLLKRLKSGPPKYRLVGNQMYIRYFSLMEFLRLVSRANWCWLRTASRLSEKGSDREYIFFPLHVLPESSTLTWGPEYYEVDFIKRLSHKLPVTTQIFVKENPSMVGLRSSQDLKALKQLPNVQVLPAKAPTLPFIANAAGVIGISGTALLEAALLDVPVLALGEPEFVRCLDFVGEDDLGRFLSNLRPEIPPQDLTRVSERVSMYLSERDARSTEFSPGKNLWDTREIEASACCSRAREVLEALQMSRDAEASHRKIIQSN